MNTVCHSQQTQHTQNIFLVTVLVLNICKIVYGLEFLLCKALWEWYFNDDKYAPWVTSVCLMTEI